MFWWVVTPILAFYLKMSTGVPIDRISHHSHERDRARAHTALMHTVLDLVWALAMIMGGDVARAEIARSSNPELSISTTSST